MPRKRTIFQTLDSAMRGDWTDIGASKSVASYDMSSKGSDIIYRTDSKTDYENKKLELRQNKYMHDRWVRANIDLSINAFSGLNKLKLMFNEVDLMDSSPEIGAALDTYSEEASIANSKGMVVNVYSKSDRVKSILEDLFVNRLNVQVMAQMVIRGMCKYGNQYMLLDIDSEFGVKGWRQLPVFEVERVEDGISGSYGLSMPVTTNQNGDKDYSTKFIWYNERNTSKPFFSWQVAHFRLLGNSMYLPYGCSILNSARRHWRMLSLMEDMMLIYRLERSMERRVYKVFVGAIDDADVGAYVEQVASSLKRAPIIDPMTGQIDLRKNILSIDNDIFIPVRDQNAPNPIDTLSAGQNLTAMDDIKYIQKKVLAALRIPRAFLNFDETTGEGNNLALMDIRFTRMVNRIQQSFLMELTKVATIHLHLLGFEDDLTNFTLTMNNPSTQADQLEIDTLAKKVDAIRDAVSDPGNGLQVMSLQRALKDIMKWSEKEIKENFEEIRLEKAIAAELEKTQQIIKKTGIFDTVDRIYGEPGAEYNDDQGGMGGDQGGMGGGGGLGGPIGGGGGPTDFGDELGGLGSPGSDESGSINGNEGSEPMDQTGGGGGNEMPTLDLSSITPRKANLNEGNALFDKLMTSIKGNDNSVNETKHIRADVFNKAFMFNEEIDKMIESIDEFSDKKEKL